MNTRSGTDMASVKDDKSQCTGQVNRGVYDYDFDKIFDELTLPTQGVSK
jgi:hypothetical protein